MIKTVIVYLSLFMAEPTFGFVEGDIIHMNDVQLSEVVKDEIFNNPSLSNLLALETALRAVGKVILADRVAEFIWTGSMTK